MPIILDGQITIGRRTQTGEAVLDVFPPYRPDAMPVRTPHVEAPTLPEALRRLADVMEAPNTEKERK
jgi:hypothetical protein